MQVILLHEPCRERSFARALGDRGSVPWKDESRRGERTTHGFPKDQDPQAILHGFPRGALPGEGLGELVLDAWPRLGHGRWGGRARGGGGGGRGGGGGATDGGERDAAEDETGAGEGHGGVVGGSRGRGDPHGDERVPLPYTRPARGISQPVRPPHSTRISLNPRPPRSTNAAAAPVSPSVSPSGHKMTRAIGPDDKIPVRTPPFSSLPHARADPPPPAVPDRRMPRAGTRNARARARGTGAGGYVGAL